MRKNSIYLFLYSKEMLRLACVKFKKNRECEIPF